MKWGDKIGICSTKEAAEALRKLISKYWGNLEDDANQ